MDMGNATINGESVRVRQRPPLTTTAERRSSRKTWPDHCGADLHVSVCTLTPMCFRCRVSLWSLGSFLGVWGQIWFLREFRHRAEAEAIQIIASLHLRLRTPFPWGYNFNSTFQTDRRVRTNGKGRVVSRLKLNWVFIWTNEQNLF